MSNMDQNETPKIAPDSSIALRVELHFSHQPCSFIDCTNQHPQMRHQIRHGKRVRKAFRASHAITQPQRQHKTVHNACSTATPAYCRARRVFRANRANDFAFSTALNRSKPTPSLYTADASRTTPSSLQNGNEVRHCEGERVRRRGCTLECGRREDSRVRAIRLWRLDLRDCSWGQSIQKRTKTPLCRKCEANLYGPTMRALFGMWSQSNPLPTARICS
jgi:hypothetical protein